MTSRPVVRPTVRRAVDAVESLETRRLFAAPAVDAIAAYSAPVGKTVQIPVTSASDAGAVTYSVRVGNKSVTAYYHSTKNTYIQMNVAGYSQPMVFQLFNDTTPETIRRIVGLVNSGFYNGLTFHRIVNNFVIQGGDPAGDGSGGPQFTFSDEFNAATIFSGTGQLAMANSGKDTNGSQFFITEGAQRSLDFNHTIFGQLLRGEATRQAISNLTVDSNGKPSSTVTITSIKVIRDSTDAVLVVRPSAAGSFSVKVTGTNADGSTSRSFTLNAAKDSTDDPPILNAVQPVYYAQVGKPVTISLGSTDIEGNSANVFTGQYVNQNDANGSFGTTAGTQNILTITPAKTGATTLRVGVKGAITDTTRGSTSADSTGFNIFDSQQITIAAGELPISATGTNIEVYSGISTGLTLVGQFRDSDASGSASDFTAKIDWGDGTVTDGTIKKIATGRYGIYGTKLYGSSASGAIPLTLTVTGNLGAIATATAVATVRQLATLTGGVLTINGTTGSDRISVGRKKQQYAVTVGKNTQVFATGSVTQMILYGLAGDDIIAIGSTVFAPTNIDAGTGNDQVTGGSGNDVINGNDGNDLINTGEGRNTVAGAAGNDTITGGQDRDRIYGGDGNDSLTGLGGKDIVVGDAGADVLIGGTSADSLYGGVGDDVLNGNNGADLIDGGAGTDTYRFDSLDTVVAVENRVG